MLGGVDGHGVWPKAREGGGVAHRVEVLVVGWVGAARRCMSARESLPATRGQEVSHSGILGLEEDKWTMNKKKRMKNGCKSRSSVFLLALIL